MPWENNGETYLGKTIGRAGPSFSMACRIFSVLRCPKRAAFFIGLGGGASGVDGRHFFAAKRWSGMRTEGRPFVMEGRTAFVNGRAVVFYCKGRGDFSLLCAEGKIRSRKEDRKAAGPAADFRADRNPCGLKACRHYLDKRKTAFGQKGSVRMQVLRDFRET
ncbi:MAG: hypothetical protein C6W57_11110 [Caldibacillus debilis]|nr:MAG: hypothetical protein C6W57_11110 [Caldibacillus debilis]